MLFPHLGSGGVSILLMLVIFGVGLAVEHFAPAQANQPVRHTIFNVGYAVLVSWFGVAVGPLLGIVATTAINRLGGGWIQLAGSGWMLIPSAIIYLMAVDFMEFGFHRAQHAWPFLWAMHSLHHSDPSVNVTTTARNFWLEMPIKALFVYPFVAVLFKVPNTILIIYAISTIWHSVNHLNVRRWLPIPWQVLNNPHYHRIHHSTKPEHYNRNFSPYFPLWDILCGTAVAPVTGVFPPTGLDTAETPAHIGEALVWPWRSALRRPFRASL